MPSTTGVSHSYHYIFRNIPYVRKVERHGPVGALRIWRSRVQISARGPILIEDFRDFLQFLQVNSRIL